MAAGLDGQPPDVLHVVTGEEWGGAPRIVELLATRLPTNSAVACAPNPRTVRRYDSQDLTVHPQPRLQSPPAPVDDLRAVGKLVSLCRQGGFDLIHCHSTKAGVLGRVAARLSQTPTLFTVHGWGFYNSEFNRLAPVLRRVERFLARHTDGVVCVSNHDCTVGTRQAILDGVDHWIVHNGIPPVEPPADGDPLASAGVETPGAVVGSVGRLADQKHPTELIRAGQALRDRGTDADVVWIGNGGLADRCREYAARTDRDRTHLLGFREDALELASGFDVFVLPSRFEGFPISVVEAMFLGVPVVAYDVGGVAEAVVDGETGFVVPQGDRTALVDRIEQLIHDPDLAATMGAKAARRASARFSAERMVSRYRQIYREVLDRGEESG